MRRARAIVGGYGSARASRASAVASSWACALLAGASGFFAMAGGVGAHGVLASGVAATAVLFGGLAVHATLPAPALRARPTRLRPPPVSAASQPRASMEHDPVPESWPPEPDRPLSADAAGALADLERECGELARVARSRRRPAAVTVAA
ncbi:hypothetical protein [Oharaeibacter diazotrophicus]|uniref:Uncharacterized protein n=1 Tax=Oharaeibacter diazotrophicus TaxID=1920512 RepID=A0A4R6R7W6_9HYPH|nr:hypothetical protein [Oharaeibacter diazotrophicus]TDP81855.1 hypothetical protein EDD54_4115 [Oharaeibacter diazotrophicus]BBE73487.1 hypothetical protein OHA_1_03100 [Pleomorphomonas sp. SM30]GLS75276.1 hypothetical protein GCM10007904_06110 [Oharaeibacter diazotrophicus]